MSVRKNLRARLPPIGMLKRTRADCKLASEADRDVALQAVEQKQVAQQQAERARYMVLKAGASGPGTGWHCASAVESSVLPGSGGEEANDHPCRRRERATH